MVNGTRDRDLDIGLIGREGVTGLPVIMGTDSWPHRTLMLTAGGGRRIPAVSLISAMKRSATLHQTLLKYCHAFLIQSAQTALSNGVRKIEPRLARKLCMAHDRTDGDELVLTHQLLALMLGARRPVVTLAVDRLAKAGLIKVGRGRIFILNRTRLEKRADHTYGRAEAEFDRLFG